jgi:hypothetical protein
MFLVKTLKFPLSFRSKFGAFLTNLNGISAYYQELINYQLLSKNGEVKSIIFFSSNSINNQLTSTRVEDMNN